MKLYICLGKVTDSAMEESFEREDKSGGESSSEEDERSGESIVEALKKVVEGRKEALVWVAGLLEDEAEDREEEGKMFLFCLRRLKTVTSSVASQSLWLENSAGGFLDQSRRRLSTWAALQ